MEELESSAVQAPEQTVPGWYEGVSLEDAELYIHANLKSAARSVIAIGYYLKCVKAKELFAEAGFKDIYDYARERFGFSNSTTNRYMTRNDKFSINGNSPILDEKYKDFNKSQLQEMLSLDSEQLEKVTPEMSVLQIREMKKPKEIPYVAIPGQVELTDFPGIEPEDVAAASKTREEASASRPEKPTYTISAEDLLPDPETQEQEQSIAISQQEPEPEPEVLHFIAGDRTIDNAYGATIAAVVRAYLESGYSRPEKECEVTAFGLVYKVLKRQDITVFYADTGRTVFDIENARLEEEYQYWHGTKAEPEPAGQTPPEPEPEPEPPESEQAHLEKSGKCIHRPEFDCTLEEAHKLIPGTGEDCSWVCCWECIKHGDCELECYSSQRRPEHLETQKAEPGCPPLDAADAQQGETVIPHQEECVLDFYHYHMSKRCAQAANDRDAKVLKQELISNHGKRHNSGSTSYGFYQCDPDRIYFQDDMCETFMSLTWNGYVRELFKLLENSKCTEIEDAAQESGTMVSESNPPETVIDGEFTEIQEPEKDIQEPEESLTELQIAQGELERAKRLLEKGLGCGVDENDIHIRRLKTAVCAWASYVCDLDSIVNPPPKPVQPELPLLKNNDQRAAFIDSYETWPLWIETAQTGERYYRYDLEDGTSMVVKVYHARLFVGYAPGSYDVQYHDGYGRHEYYLLQQGKFFRDCDTNRSLLIEKLKEIQKTKKG